MEELSPPLVFRLRELFHRGHPHQTMWFSISRRIGVYGCGLHRAQFQPLRVVSSSRVHVKALPGQYLWTFDSDNQSSGSLSATGFG